MGWELVRFPDPLVEVGRENEGPESGEFFFHGRLWQKFSLKVGKGAQNWLSQHVNSHFLADQTRESALVAAVELLFFLHCFGTFPSLIWDFHTTVFPSRISFRFLQICFRFSCFDAGSSLHLFGTFPSLIWDFHTTIFSERNPTGKH